MTCGDIRAEYTYAVTGNGGDAFKIASVEASDSGFKTFFAGQFQLLSEKASATSSFIKTVDCCKDQL
jgi:hypothetical protein